MKHFGSISILSCALASLWSTASVAEAAEPAPPPLAIPTFHALGIYWSPPGGAASQQALVRYRRQGSTDWQQGLPMRYNPIPNTEEDLADYRGSIVHLTPGTTYEVLHSFPTRRSSDDRKSVV